MNVTRFLEQFYPSETESIWLRTFNAKGRNDGYPQNIETCREQLKTDKAFQDRLRGINKTQGIYFTVNAGGTKDADITRVNAVFAEIDDRPIQEQHDILDYQSPWSPSIRVETKKSVHAYWLLSEPITTENFLEIQQGLIAFYSSDKSIKNLSRVMRVPLFNHVSWADGWHYKPITVHTFQPQWTYSLAELREGFPYKPTPEHIQQYDKPTGRLETLDDVKAELRARIMATKSWKAHGKWGSANGLCHNGEGDTGLRIDLASGAVTCWSDCSLKQILAAFNLELPKHRTFETVAPREQKSELYRWYQDRKRVKNED